MRAHKYIYLFLFIRTKYSQTAKIVKILSLCFGKILVELVQFRKLYNSIRIRLFQFDNSIKIYIFL